MSEESSNTRLPVDQFNAELRRLGRSMDSVTDVDPEWRDGELGLQIAWTDGYAAFVSLGPMATAIVESSLSTVKH